jgi:hypothetical protein
MKRLAIAVVVMSLLAVACACKSRGAGGTGNGTGTATGTGTGTGKPGDCEGIRANVEALYRAAAEADVKASAKDGDDPAKLQAAIDEQTADNLAMVMTDCAADPGRVAACAAKARNVAELEASCLIPIDDTGSEGDQFKGK